MEREILELNTAREAPAVGVSISVRAAWQGAGGGRWWWTGGAALALCSVSGSGVRFVSWGGGPSWERHSSKPVLLLVGLGHG